MDLRKNESEVNTPLKTTSLDKEPAFVKLYVEHLLYFKELNYTETSTKEGCSEKAMMVLFAIADRLSYANPNMPYGGLTIDMTKSMKECIAKQTGVKPNTIKKYLTQFTEADILRRVERGKYQANPYIFGRGEWKDIKDIIVTYNYKKGNFNPFIETK